VAVARLSLPRGIALLRVDTAFGKFVVCSSALTEEEERIARAIAADRIRRRAAISAVLLNVLDLLAVIQDAAA